MKRKKKIKRLLATFVSVMMLFAGMQLTVSAEGETVDEITNIAIGRAVTVSGTSDGNKDYVNDGNSASSSKWDSNFLKSGGTANGDTAWVCIDLGETQEYEISKVVVYFHNLIYPTDYTLQISDDGNVWSDVRTLNHADGDSACTNLIETIELDTRITGRYVRLFFRAVNLNAAGNGVGVKEFEIYGKEKSAADEENIINLKVGESKTINGSSTETDTDIVSFEQTDALAPYELVTDTTIPSGKYLIANNNKNYYLKTGIVIDGAVFGGWPGFSFSSFDANADHFDSLFTITAVSGGYTIQNASGKYLNFTDTRYTDPWGDRAAIKWEDAQQVFTIVSTASGYTIKTAINSSDYCLNNYGNSNTVASGYRNSNGSDYAGWYFYKPTNPVTTVTGKTVGSQTAVIGDTEYKIEVGERIAVVDFGLPLSNTYLTDMQLEEGTKETAYGSVTVTRSTYNLNNDTFNVNATFDSDLNGKYTYQITYTPAKTLDGIDEVTLTDDKSTGAYFKVYPANSVYYEESAATYTNVTETEGWSLPGSSTTLDYRSTDDANADNYGYNAVYANGQTGPSDGTEAVSTKAGNSAAFNFTGTGVDIYANCGSGDNQTGTMSVIVRERTVNGDQISYGVVKKLVIVDTSVAGNTDSATASQNNVTDAYGVKVVSVDGLDSGTYAAGIRHNPTTVKTDAGTDGGLAVTYPIKLDGFRVYNTLDDCSVFTAHGEANAKFVEMRDNVLSQYIDAENANDFNSQVLELISDGVLTDTDDAKAIIVNVDDNGNILTDGAQDVLTNGPKNEIFLFSGQKLIFGLKAGLTNVQIGLKAVDNAADAAVTVGDTATTYNIQSSTDMFYKLGDTGEDTTVTITNNGTGVLSITDLKYFVNDLAIDTVAENDTPLLPVNKIDLVKALTSVGTDDGGETPDPNSGTGETNTDEKELPFIDVADEDWCYDYISYVYDKGLMTGLTKDTFGPLDSIVRAQFAVILHRAEGEPLVKCALEFEDVENSTWYTEAVRWANASKIATGYSDTKLFGTNDPITREQMAVMMYRYANYKKYNVDEAEAFSKFEDAVQVSGFAQEAMKWAVGTGIISGKDNGTRLDPQGNASRAECAAIIMRFNQKYNETE